MKFSELTRFEEIGVRSLIGPTDADLSDACYDSRSVRPGALFVAIRGLKQDGHDHVEDAIRRGARAIVIENGNALSDERAASTGVLKIVVENSRHALAIISEDFFGNPSRTLRLIGVTGTNGKTTVTHILKQLLEARGERVGLLGTVGNMIGDRFLEATHTTPESRNLSALLRSMVAEGMSTCVMEVSSHALVLSRVAALDFDIAIFTNLTQDHLDFHNTMNEYLAAKRLLFSSLRDTAVAITNADSDFGEAVVSGSVANVHSYGIALDGTREGCRADLCASDVQLSTTETTFQIRKRYSEERAAVQTRLIGSFNVENMLAAIAGLYFGVPGCSLDVLASAAKNVHPVRGRFETIPLPNGALAIVDYAHTPDALEHLLRTVGQLMTNSSAHLITVFGCGGDRDKGKRPIMGSIAARLSDRVIVTNDNPRSELPENIAEEILRGIASDSAASISVLLDRHEAIEDALALSNSSDIVVIAGKGHEDYQIIGAERRHFDDREEVLLWARTHK